MAIEHDKSLGYRLVEQEFDLTELKLLVDAVQSSRFISADQSDKMIRKLKGLTSEHKGKELQRQVTVKHRIKSGNKSTLYSIDTVHTAILNDKKIAFQYWGWTPSKEQKARHGGKKYVVSPWMLLWDDEYYYLVAYNEESREIRHYRADRMRNVSMVNEKREGREIYEKIDVGEYSSSVFGMFGGNKTHVTFRCANRLADVVLDRFGGDVMMIPEQDGTFRFHADIDVSPQFFGWVASFGKELYIEKPQGVRKQFANHLKEALGLYEE